MSSFSVMIINVGTLTNVAKYGYNRQVSVRGPSDHPQCSLVLKDPNELPVVSKTEYYFICPPTKTLSLQYTVKCLGYGGEPPVVLYNGISYHDLLTIPISHCNAYVDIYDVVYKLRSTINIGKYVLSRPSNISEFNVTLHQQGIVLNIPAYPTITEIIIREEPSLEGCLLTQENGNNRPIVSLSKFSFQCPRPPPNYGHVQYTVYCEGYDNTMYNIYEGFQPIAMGITIPLQLCYAYGEAKDRHSLKAVKHIRNIHLVHPYVELTEFGVNSLPVGSLGNVNEFPIFTYILVVGPPWDESCSIIPEKAETFPIVSVSTFTFQCPPAPKSQGPLTYNVFCRGNKESSGRDIYKDFYASGTGITIPVQICDAYVTITNVFGMTSENNMTTFVLTYPPVNLAEYDVSIVTIGQLGNVPVYPSLTKMLVRGPPDVAGCSLTQEDRLEKPIVSQTTFIFQCLYLSLKDGPVKFTVFCSGNKFMNYVIYKGFYPSERGITVPTQLCDVHVNAESVYSISSTNVIAKLVLNEKQVNFTEFGLTLVSVFTIKNVPEYPSTTALFTRGPPEYKPCSFTPQNVTEHDYLIVSKTNFMLQCSPASAKDGPVKYRVVCNEMSPPSYEIYSDFHPTATGITIPIRLCYAQAKFSNEYNLTATQYLGPIHLYYSFWDPEEFAVDFVTIGTLNYVAKYSYFHKMLARPLPTTAGCSITPESGNTQQIVSLSTFAFQCPHSSPSDGPWKYTVFCSGDKKSSDVNIYEDFYPKATDITIPIESCQVKVKIENSFSLSATEIIGHFNLIHPPMNLTHFGVTTVSVGYIPNVATYPSSIQTFIIGKPHTGDCYLTPENEVDPPIVSISKFTFKCLPPFLNDGPTRYTVVCKGNQWTFDHIIYSDFYASTTGITIPVHVCEIGVNKENMYTMAMNENLGEIVLNRPPENLTKFAVASVTVGLTMNVVEYASFTIMFTPAYPETIECSLTPEDENSELIVSKSRFTFRCSVSDTLVKYTLFCKGDKFISDQIIHSGFYPNVTGILIPMQFCAAYTKIKNVYNQAATISMGEIILKQPYTNMEEYVVDIINLGSLENVSAYPSFITVFIRGPPQVEHCLIKLNEEENSTQLPIVSETTFNLQCEADKRDGPLEYTVICTGNDWNPTIVIDKNFYPRATGITIPIELCGAYVTVENTFNMNETKNLGTFNLTRPPVNLNEFGVTMVAVNSTKNIAEYLYLTKTFVSRRPEVSDCSLTPENTMETPTVSQTIFRFRCLYVSSSDGPLNYVISCNPSASRNQIIYDDFYPHGTGITIPSKLCEAYITVQSVYNITFTSSIGNIVLSQKSVNVTDIEVNMASVGTLTNVSTYPSLTHMVVIEPPNLDDCSLKPEEPTKPNIVSISTFIFQCTPSVSGGGGPVKYSVICKENKWTSINIIYSDFYLSGAGIIIPVQLCDAFVNVENAYAMNREVNIGIISQSFQEPNFTNFGVTFMVVSSLQKVPEYPTFVQMFVKGPPKDVECSLTPEKKTETEISTFSFQCLPASVSNGPVKYTVMCLGSDWLPQTIIYSDFYPHITGIRIPIKMCNAEVSLESTYNLITTITLGQYKLSSISIDLSEFGVTLVTIGGVPNVTEYSSFTTIFVRGPPEIVGCSLTPENDGEALTVSESMFSLQCHSASVSNGPVKYNLFCLQNKRAPNLIIYSHFYSSVTGITIPIQLCEAYIALKTAHNLTRTQFITQLDLNQRPVNLTKFDVGMVTVGTTKNISEFPLFSQMRVRGQPQTENCSLTPEEEGSPAIVSESTFIFRCSSPSVNVVTRYSVFCKGYHGAWNHTLYSGFIGIILGLTISVEFCEAYTMVEDQYHMSRTINLGKLYLNLPPVDLNKFGVTIVSMGKVEVSEYPSFTTIFVNALPQIGDCTFTPQDPMEGALIVSESKFTFKCLHPHYVNINTMKYSVLCEGKVSMPNITLYSDFYPTAKEIKIPVELCDLLVTMENVYNISVSYRMQQLILIPQPVNLTAFGIRVLNMLVHNVSEYPTFTRMFVRGPPDIDVCTLTPENPSETPVAFETKFIFQCLIQSTSYGPLKYSAFCTENKTDSEITLYSDFYPNALGVIIPAISCVAYATVENAYNQNKSVRIGDFSLENFVLPLLSQNTTDNETMLDNLAKVVDNLTDAVPSDTPDAAITKIRFLTIVATAVNETLENSTTATQNRSSKVLLSMSKQLLNMANVKHDTLLEEHFKNSSKQILETTGLLMKLQTKQPNVTDEDMRLKDKVASELRETVSTISNTLLNRTTVGKMINVSTPDIEMKVWKTDKNDTIGKKLKIKDIDIEIPQGIGQEGVVSMVAVATKINPDPRALLPNTTNFINVTFKGTGIEDKDFPVVYRYPRNANVTDETDSPYVINFNLSGNAHCVRYNSAKKLYGWRVISKAATMKVNVPSGGRAFITINSNVSSYIGYNTHTIDMVISNETIGKICWPITNDVTFQNIKIAKSITQDNKEELWIENGLPKNAEISLKFLISYSERTGVNPPEMCEPKVSRKGTLVYPVNSSLHILQKLGQCLKYNVEKRMFLHDENCTVYPEKDSIRCECRGASVLTAVDPPVTNNIDFSDVDIDLENNPVPLIFTVTILGLFLLLCVMGIIQDILSKKRLSPLVDPTQSNKSVMYNVFIYLSKFRWVRGMRNQKFCVTLNGRAAMATNTFTSRGVSHGAMLHLLHRSDQPLGHIISIALIPLGASMRWHVSRVVVSDALQNEIVAFKFNSWVSGGPSFSTRMTDAERNVWRENFFVKVISGIMEAIPVLMLLLASSVEGRKLDQILTYALGIVIWALLHLWFYEAIHPLYRPDDCIEGSLSSAQAAISSIQRMLLNIVLIVASSIVILGTIKLSLMYKEKKSPETRNWRANGHLPLPHWVRLLVRGIAVMVVIMTISFLTIMAYMFTLAEFNTWLLNIAEAFIFQLGTKAVGKLVSIGAIYLLYLPNPESFNEAMINPEGMRVMCPLCNVRPQALHRHFRSHISLDYTRLYKQRLFSDTPNM